MSKNTQKTLADETNQLVHQIVNEGLDGIIGGWPCQDLSFAGRGAGLSGSRSGLWRYMLRTIRLVRPKYAVLENVAALLSRGMGKVLGDLAQIGYDTEWHCLQADALGLPHRRKRVFAIAYPAGLGLPPRFPQTIYGQQGLPGWQDHRSLENVLRGLDLPEPLLRRSHDGLASRLHAIGNGNPPEFIRQITKGLK